MKPFLILCIVACVTNTLAAPEAGYKYNKDPAPVIEHGNLNGFQPIAGHPSPCSHAAHNHGDSFGAGAAFIQSQSNGRILNHQHHQGEHSLETAASGYSPQSQAVTVNSHIVVGDSGTAASSFSAGSQEFRPGQGYVQAQPQFQPQFQPPSIVHQPQPQPQFPPPPPQFNPLPQLPPQLPAQPFIPVSLPPGKVVPSQVVSGQTQGYAYTQGGGGGGAAAQHIHHHYTAGGSGGAIINGVGKVPPPPPPPFAPQNIGGGFQYAAGFSGNRFVSPPQTSYGAPANFGGPAPYRPPGPVIPGPIGNVGAPRPVQHFGSATNSFGNSNSFAGSNSYAGSYSHNAHNAQFSGGNNFGGNHGQAAANFGAAQGGAALFTGSSGHDNALSGQLGNVIRETFANAPLDPSVEKHIYVHVPPEDLEENAGGKHAATELLPHAKPKKHYKIIFIKAPTAAQPNYAQLASATQQSEEKTLVYVLVKKPDEPSFEELQQIQQSSIKSSKPEVYFIKYKTRKENEAPTYNTNTQFGAGGDQFVTNNQFTSTGGGYNSNSGGYSSSAGSEVDGSGNIDIRLNSGGAGGESSGVSTSTSYSTSSSSSSSGLSIGESSGPRQEHELYGVPLE